MNKKVVIGVVATAVVIFSGAIAINYIQNKTIKTTEAVSFTDMKISKAGEVLKEKVIDIAKNNNIVVEKSNDEIELNFGETKTNQIVYESEMIFPDEKANVNTTFIVKCKPGVQVGEKANIDLSKGFIGEITDLIVGTKVDLSSINDKVNEWVEKNSTSKKLRATMEIDNVTIDVQERKNGEFVYQVIKK
ncbi:MAG: hypothetical protein ACRCWM_05240 [Sarcina sp.]